MAVLNAIAAGLREGGLMFWQTLWALVLGFGLSGVVQAFVSRGAMERSLGRTDVAGVARATFFGMVSSSCSYAASAMAKSLYRKGATFTNAMIFMLASTNLVIELGLVLWLLLGWQFTAAEFIGGAIMISILALLSRWIFPLAVLPTKSGENRELSADSQPQRWKTLQGWRQAAAYTLADIKMLRRELLIGYLVAGFIAALVPASWWNVFFIHGHGWLTEAENVIVGPLIAVLSFVCSIGNVPLAAALWNGGISFGGAVSFIFADLITIPLLLIYRQFYGWRVMVRILGGFWLIMAAAGLLVNLIFTSIGVAPTSHNIASGSLAAAWNYTAFLNIVAVALFLGLLWLRSRPVSAAAVNTVATDPICGMTVEIANAAATAHRDGVAHYFCSEHCREQFLRQAANTAPR